MTPAELLGLAEELALRCDEAARRTAVSLAYYASYHHFRILIGRGERPSDHVRVLRWLRHNRPYAAGGFEELRATRTAADYHIEAPFTADPRGSCVAARMLLEVT